MSINRVENKAIKIIKPGMLTTIQDKGRYMHQHLGVPVAGVMDYYAYRMSNILVGNDQNAAVLEATYICPKIEILGDMFIAITGGDMSPVINGVFVPMWQTLHVEAGSLLSFGSLKTGVRCYISFSGGIECPVVMESRSTDLRSKIGGLDGRKLSEGDVLKIGMSTKCNVFRKTPPKLIPEYLKNQTIRVVLGPQEEYFTKDGINQFLSESYTVGRDYNRMGYRLEGSLVETVKGSDIISDGITMGNIQITGNGLPIILLADRQTVGGYAKIATVISADLHKVVQAKQGDSFKFESVSLLEAHKLLYEMENKLKKMETSSGYEENTKSYFITINDKKYVVTSEQVN